MTATMVPPAEEGYQAFLSGESIDDNPYSALHEFHNFTSWNRGWNDAAVDNSQEIDL